MDDINSPGGAPQGSGGAEESKGQEQNQDNKQESNKVAFETYKKALDEAKRAKERLSQFEKREKEELEKSGQFQKLYEELKAENEALKAQSKEERGFFAHHTVASQFRLEAAKAGCQRLDALEKLIDLDDLKASLDSSLRVDPQALKSKVDQAMKEFDFLFGKSAPSFRDAQPAGQPPEKPSLKAELAKVKTQKEFDEVMKKHGLA